MLLGPNNSAYIMINADFALDPLTAEAISAVQDLISSIDDLLKMEEGDNALPPYDTTDYLVGAGSDIQEVKDLDIAVQEAQTVIAGEEIFMDVTTDDFERYTVEEAAENPDHTAGEFKIGDDGERIPLVVRVTYRVYYTDKINAAKEKLIAAIANAKGKVNKYIPTSVPLSSLNDTDKVWKSVTIVDAGVYKITINGANGGHAWARTGVVEFGGFGGYVEAQKTFAAGDVLKIRIGTEGRGRAKLNNDKTGLELDGLVKDNQVQTGGWPNGGNGGSGYTSISGASGGGATEVYYAGNRGPENSVEDTADNLLTNRSSNLLLVAGGGGGAGTTARVDHQFGKGDGKLALPGGNAGEFPVPAMRCGPEKSMTATYTISTALSAPYENFLDTTATYNKLRQIAANSYWYGEYAGNSGVTYGTTDGRGANGANGKYGVAYEGSGGGGGGYLGGNAPVNTGMASGGSGGGGSNYIKNDFSDTKNETAAVYGNGTFKIEYIGSTD
jgi:hypothetical protein